MDTIITSLSAAIDKLQSISSANPLSTEELGSIEKEIKRAALYAQAANTLNQLTRLQRDFEILKLEGV